MANFQDSIGVVLENEGGYEANPNDPGGETNFGISKRSYPDVDIKNLTRESAEAIYLRDFWRFGGIASQPVATKLFDSYVNMEHTAIKLAQEVAGVGVDGFYGGNTEYAINAMDPALFLSRYRIFLAQYYTNLVLEKPSDTEFLAGWLTRARQ